MSEMKHAKLPYHFGRGERIGDFFIGGGGFAIAEMVGPKLDREHNAAFIVTACNSHYDNLGTIDALKAENERLRDELDVRVGDLVMLRKAIQENDPKIELFFRIDDMLRETRAALTKQEV